MGLDLYNRPGETLGSRIKNVRKLYISAMTLRMIRFLPAYGLGGVFNKELRGVFTSMEL